MPRVLLVEDEESAAEVLSVILNLEGFQVTLAPNGKRAIEMLDAVKPELIITDYMMPIMNGVEMATVIRAKPEYAGVPILMTSGVPEAGLTEHASLLSAFLRKPFLIDALLEAVGRLLGNAGEKQTTNQRPRPV
jgi:two-component system, OmpR family, response regulator VicR